MTTWRGEIFRPSDRDVRHVQRPHGIFGRYRQPTVGWCDREAVERVLRQTGLTWADVAGKINPRR